MATQPANFADRLGSMLFIAALAHGLVILGITFSAPSLEPAEDVPSLNVTLVVDTGRADPAPEQADFLADRNQQGGGELTARERATTTLSADQPFAQPGDPAAADAVDGAPREAAPEPEQLVTRGASERQLQALPDATENPAESAREAAAMLQRIKPQSLAAELDDQAAAPVSDDPDALAAPSARESAVAEYLVGWRERVERVGTANFPEHFLDGSREYARPMLEVAIGPDGQLEEIVVRRSSGDTRLDQAALGILRLAAPFEPLPEALLAEHDVLRFAYEWDFSAGGLAPAN